MKPNSKETDAVAMAEATRIVGVDASTLRRWELDGLISSTRTPGNHRRYRRADLIALIESAEQAAS